MQGVYVQPKTNCPHVTTLDISGIQSRFTKDTYVAPCKECGDESENWLCLTCEQVYCSRYVNSDMSNHNASTGHPVALSFTDASVWCYNCDSYITNRQLTSLTRRYGEIKFESSESTKSTAEMTPLPQIPEETNEETVDNAEMEEKEEEEEEPNYFASYVYSPPRERIAFPRAEFINGLRNKSFKKIVVLSGAGISVAAGIPDFRSPGTGLYSRLQELGLPFAEAVFQLSYFRENPKPFYEVAKWFLTLEGQPTRAHRFLKYLHSQDQLLVTCTQNIDGLEIVAGLPEEKVIQAHGHLRTSRCIDCKQSYSTEDFFEHLKRSEIFRCSLCCSGETITVNEKGLIKPDIVFFGESLPSTFFQVMETIQTADMVIVMGTSLKVFPFAMLVEPMICPETIPLVLINRENPGVVRDNFLFLEGDIENTIQSIADELNVTL